MNRMKKLYKTRKEGITCTAIEYTGNNGTIIMDFLGIDMLREPIGLRGRPVLRLATVDVDTGEDDGNFTDVCIGDYVGQGPDWEFFSLSKTDFEKTFEEVIL